jgi:hypothetical protein
VLLSDCNRSVDRALARLARFTHLSTAYTTASG